MDRKDFFKSVCKYGACGCAGIMMLSPTNLLANDDTSGDKEEDWRIGFIQNRMAKLIEDMSGKLDTDTLEALMENMGRFCSKGESEKNVKYKGDLNGYLKSIEQWVERIEHDEKKGTIKIVGKKSDSCFCPFVDTSKMPKEFCNCSKGWQKGAYEAIIGNPVDVNIDVSVLRGGDRCGFTVTYPV